MGEVFRARDTRLNRDVAIKVLPPLFADDPDRLARFGREAQTLAALNHPNIAQIHGLEETQGPGSGVRALVMELVEGEDLSAIIGRGPVAIADALPIARQIADALEAAHDLGIIHRDLKPANVKVRPDGTVKVLDFGLAKALDADDSSSAANALHSPTMTQRATAVGTIIGTAAYMAPEQARGKAVDRRADIWAFGVVLYEMLTGCARLPRRRPIGGAGHRPQDGAELARAAARDTAGGSPAAAPLPREGSAQASELHRRRAAGTGRERPCRRVRDVPFESRRDPSIVGRRDGRRRYGGHRSRHVVRWGWTQGAEARRLVLSPRRSA